MLILHLLLLLLLSRCLFFLPETQRSSVLSLLLSSLHDAVIFDLILGYLDDLLRVVELLLDDQGVDDLTWLARSEAMMFAAALCLRRHDLLFLNYICLLLLHNGILNCSLNVVRINDEVVDVDLNES